MVGCELAARLEGQQRRYVTRRRQSVSGWTEGVARQRGQISRSASLVFRDLCPVEGGSISRTNQCDIPGRARVTAHPVCSRRRSGDATARLRWGCHQFGSGPSDCWEEGMEVERKRRRKWERRVRSPTHPHPHPIATAAGVVENRGFAG